jgi:thioester reductase-like protein
MRAVNINGTTELLRMAFQDRLKEVNYVSTTFIFGWATRARLWEADDHPEMAALDFGYSQSKWVAEQLAINARREGLPVRIYRPALITPSPNMGTKQFDII